MAVDVLFANAYKESLTIGALNAAWAANTTTGSQGQGYANNTAFVDTSPCGAYNFWGRPGLWNSIPYMNTPVGNLLVTDTDGYSNGAYCAWTVPAGATLAKFTLWGPGASSGASQCCGFTPSGATGAVAVVITPVTPGEVYCLCAGCADTWAPPVCVCASWCPGGVARGEGVASRIFGPGMCNVCAEGGRPSIFANVKARAQCMGYGTSFNCCRWTHYPYSSTGGSCICNDYMVCFAGSCDSCGPMGALYDRERNAYGTSRGMVYRIPSIFQGYDYTSDNYGCFYTVLPYDATPGTTNSGYDCRCLVNTNYSVTSPSCHAAGIGIHRKKEGGTAYVSCVPGLGGYFTHAMGGCTSLCGDNGRNGAVCVQWI